ncbi:TPR end-of-group domain-containing protein [Frigoriglobus tundricola]|uniref:Peptidase S9 prolyl oligopeptidase catalytic domain-containing protein n=1 Tax=Frigoriglobus tundricola TaxID=2774151 RepID=A0A6M5YTQ7_9BACT|nr:prolyl oligopeptidase family serine peptidase [Frigoriglobus tundricola]QJW96824.1 hypothetical protein FTUN_4384 [Frigoriglobus tundricola]
MLRWWMRCGTGLAVSAAWACWLGTQPAQAQTPERLLNLAKEAYNQKRYAAASDLYLQVIDKTSRDPGIPYNAACCLAQADRINDAFRLLELAIEYGWKNADHLASDPDLKRLHSDPRWNKMRDKLVGLRAQEESRRPWKAALGIDLEWRDSYWHYFRFTEHRRLMLEGKAASGREGGPLGSGTWYRLEPKSDGWIYNRHNTVIQVDWDEPQERTVLLTSHPREYISINGELRFGGQGWQHIIPVRLKKGKNTIVCDHQLVAELYPAHHPYSFISKTLLVPDLREGETGEFRASVTVLNATPKAGPVTITAGLGNGPNTETTSRPIAAMNARAVGFSFRVPEGYKPGEQLLRLTLSDGGETTTAPVRVVGRTEAYQRTFISRFDGMVRHYAINPSSSGRADQPVVLALPGAGWEARRTAQSYEQRSWGHIVCPLFRGATNGEGVSRQTVLESLEQAIKELRADPKQVFLIGYSAGGHGAWQIASLNPGLFSGVGASAGWISYFTYMPTDRPRLDTTDPVQKIFARASSEIDVEARFDALATIPNVGLVHGDRDKVVSVNESRRVKKELERRGVKPFYHEQPGADHGWATSTADQVDFPPLLDHLKKHSRPGTGDIWGGERLPRTWHDLLARPVVAVYGTNGTAEEHEAARTGALMLMDRCRLIYSADCEVVPDTVPLADLRGKNVLLYGSPSSNRLWEEHPTAKGLLKSPSAQKATSFLMLGDRDGVLWGSIGGKTLFDCRVAYGIDPMSQMYAFPDWVLLTREVLDKDFEGVHGAGWFNRDGKIDDQRSAWR